MHLTDLTLWQWTLAFLAAFFIGVSKTGFAGVGLVGIFLMAEIMPARASTGVILPLLVFADAWVLRSLAAHAKWPLIRSFLPFAMVGILVGFALFSHIPEDRFRLVMGVLVLMLVAAQYLRRYLLSKVAAADRQHRGPNWLAGSVLGLVGGINTMLANSAGPFMAMYLLLDPTLGKWQFVGTNAWMFFIINTSKLPFSWSLGLITGQTLLFNLCLIPGILAGVVVGRALLERISQRVFEELLILFCLVAALRLILH